VPDHAELIEFYRSYGEATFAAEEPVYADVCRTLADYPEIVAMLAEHDPEAQQPNLLFAAARYLVLGGLDHPLARAYTAPLFVDVVLSHRPEINDLLATRRTQTNEVGRCSVIALMLAHAQQRTGRSLAWIDLGTSGGLNLNIDRFHIAYSIDGQEHTTGDTGSDVQLGCTVRSGRPQIRSDHAGIGWRVGIDRTPIDVGDPDQARWLQACLWPSKTERHRRLAAAIAIANDFPPQIIEAEAVEGLVAALEQAPPDLELVVTTTWVWYYLPETTKHQVLELLRSSPRRVSWYSLEGRGVVTELGQPGGRNSIDSQVGLVELGGGEPDRAHTLGLAHAHGAWLDYY